MINKYLWYIMQWFGMFTVMSAMLAALVGAVVLVVYGLINIAELGILALPITLLVILSAGATTVWFIEENKKDD